MLWTVIDDGNNEHVLGQSAEGCRSRVETSSVLGRISGSGQVGERSRIRV